MPHLDISALEKTINRTSSAPTISGTFVEVTEREYQPRVEEGDPDTDPPKAGRQVMRPQVSDATSQLAANNAYLDHLGEDIRLPYGPLRMMDVARLSSRWELMEQLNKELPLNDLDLPNYFYSPDKLDHTFLAKTLRAASELATANTLMAGFNSRIEVADGIREAQAQIESAIVSLDYLEGFPAVNRAAYWYRLSIEDEQSYAAFQRYKDQAGARQLSALVGYDPLAVNEWYHLYNWGYRIKAFDQFRDVDEFRSKVIRGYEVERKHYNQASTILDAINEHLALGDNLANKIEELPLDKLVSTMANLIKVQRISVGLGANGPSLAPLAPRALPTPQVIAAVVAETTRPAVTAKRVEEYDLLKEDPDSLELAQKLIISTQKTRNAIVPASEDPVSKPLHPDSPDLQPDDKLGHSSSQGTLNHE